MNVLNNLHLVRAPPHRKAEYLHKDHFDDEYNDIFRKKYCFKKETVHELADYLHDELSSIVKSNNAYTAE